LEFLSIRVEIHGRSLDRAQLHLLYAIPLHGIFGEAKDAGWWRVMNKAKAQEFCRRWLPAWTGNQPDTLVDFYSDNAVYIDPANKEGLRGRDEILQYLRKLLAANPNWKWEAIEIFPTDAGFNAKWKATIPIGRETIIENGLDIVEVSNGKVTRNEVYFDRSGLLDAIRRLKAIDKCETAKSSRSCA
jgi:hypothetical protein